MAASRHPRVLMRAGVALAVAMGMAAFLAAGCERRVPTPKTADIARGAAAIHDHGCGSCHRIAGIAGARGVAGPPLEGLEKRVYIAGHLPNTRKNLVRFIADPQGLKPATAMPDMGVTLEEASAIAAYLDRRR